MQVCLAKSYGLEMEESDGMSMNSGEVYGAVQTLRLGERPGATE